MSDKNTGGPAFPAPHISVHNGMTLRDYFAASAPITLADAVQAADLESGAPSMECALCRVLMNKEKRAIAMATLAALRNEYADAMLKARQS